jgi:spoIIIJ-associated protein
MEWVETTGKTVAAALDAALDELGVDEQDAEVVVVSEPRAGVFGIGREEARVRARVRPATVRPKRPQRDRSTRTARSGAVAARSSATAERAENAAANPRRRRAPIAKVESDSPAATKTRARRRRAGRGRKSPSGRPSEPDREDKESLMTVEEQVDLATSFVRGVIERFGLEATTAARTDEEHIFVDVEGDDLGLLIGPRGSTLDALQELARTVVHRHGEDQVLRVVVDVAGFRKRRAEALAAFARRRAEEVLVSGVAEALEPMGAADRKIVHDTVAEFAGLDTTSEGFEPRRFVVIRPADSAAPSDGSEDEDDTSDDAE